MQRNVQQPEGESMAERMDFTDRNGKKTYVGTEARSGKTNYLGDPYGFAGIAIGKPPPGAKGWTGYGNKAPGTWRGVDAVATSVSAFGGGGGASEGGRGAGQAQMIQKIVIGLVVAAVMVFAYKSHCGSYGWWSKPLYCKLM
ncbi:unnamed protein product [Amoebophrya sp. A25]|nr:unnamed protein product [Amoebophrya sp. A25]|eukprot:GSA25T00008712001.1